MFRLFVVRPETSRILKDSSWSFWQPIENSRHFSSFFRVQGLAKPAAAGNAGDWTATRILQCGGSDAYLQVFLIQLANAFRFTNHQTFFSEDANKVRTENMELRTRLAHAIYCTTEAQRLGLWTTRIAGDFWPSFQVLSFSQLFCAAGFQPRKAIAAQSGQPTESVEENVRGWLQVCHCHIQKYAEIDVHVTKNASGLKFIKFQVVIYASNKKISEFKKHLILWLYRILLTRAFNSVQVNSTVTWRSFIYALTTTTCLSKPSVFQLASDYN